MTPAVTPPEALEHLVGVKTESTQQCHNKANAAHSPQAAPGGSYRSPYTGVLVMFQSPQISQLAQA